MATKMKIGGVKKKLTKAQDGIMTTPENKYNSSGEATQNNGPMIPSKITPGDVSKTPGSTKNFKKGGMIKKYQNGGKTGAQLKKAMYGSSMMKKGGTKKK